MHGFPCHIVKKSSREEWYLAHGMIFREIEISRVAGKFSITFWKPYWTQFFSVSTSSDTKETSWPILHFPLSIWYSDVIHWTNCIIGPLVTMCCLKLNIQISLIPARQSNLVTWQHNCSVEKFALLHSLLLLIHRLYLMLLNIWLYFPGTCLKVILFFFLLMFCSFAH